MTDNAPIVATYCNPWLLDEVPDCNDAASAFWVYSIECKHCLAEQSLKTSCSTTFVQHGAQGDDSLSERYTICAHHASCLTALALNGSCEP